MFKKFITNLKAHGTEIISSIAAGFIGCAVFVAFAAPGILPLTLLGICAAPLAGYAVHHKLYDVFSGVFAKKGVISEALGILSVPFIIAGVSLANMTVAPVIKSGVGEAFKKAVNIAPSVPGVKVPSYNPR